MGQEGAPLETQDSGISRTGSEVSSLGVDDTWDLGSYRRLASVEGASFWTRLKYHILAEHSLLGCVITEKGDTFTRKERLFGLFLVNIIVFSIAVAITAGIGFSSYRGACERTSCLHLKQKFQLEEANHTGVLQWIEANRAEAETVPDFGHLYDEFTEEKFLGESGDFGDCNRAHEVALKKFLPVIRGVEMVVTAVLSAVVAATWEFFSRCNMFDCCAKWNLGYFVLIPFGCVSIGILVVTYSICIPEMCNCPCSNADCTRSSSWLNSVMNEETALGDLQNLIADDDQEPQVASQVASNSTVVAVDDGDVYTCIDQNPQCSEWEASEGKNIFLGTCNFEYTSDAYAGRCMKVYADGGLEVFLGSLALSWVFWDFFMVAFRLAVFGTTDRSWFGVQPIPDEKDVNKDKKKRSRKSAQELQELEDAQKSRSMAKQGSMDQNQV